MPRMGAGCTRRRHKGGFWVVFYFLIWVTVKWACSLVKIH